MRSWFFLSSAFWNSSSLIFLGLLDLLLVGLYLALQLGGQLGHAVLVLLVFGVLELELLDLPLRLLVALHVVPSASLHVSKFDLQLSDAGLKLCHGGLASTHRRLVGLGKTVFHVGHLGLQGVLVLALHSHVVLLSAELLCETSSIDHRLLGFLLRVLCLVEHVVDLGLQSVNRSR